MKEIIIIQISKFLTNELVKKMLRSNGKQLIRHGLIVRGNMYSMNL